MTLQKVIARLFWITHRPAASLSFLLLTTRQADKEHD